MTQLVAAPALPIPAGASAARWLGRTWARVSYGRRIEPTWLESNQISLPVRDLPAPLQGLRIAHLTDFHGGEHLPPDYLDEVVDRTLGHEPDLIALTGDFVQKGYRHVDDVAKVLARLRAPMGVYAVLGNHDFSVRNALGWRRHRGLHKAVADSLSTRGIRVLRNESEVIEKGGVSLQVAGIDDLWSGECDPVGALQGLCPNSPRVVLAHNPLSVDHLNGERCDLMLSGHTHGGQVNWPGVGRLFIGKKARRLPAGMCRHGETPVYVNKGVGYGWRFRFGVRPEVAVFHLHRGQGH
jgi:predicted MPP superfamily phosphohydrolase